MYTLAGAVGSRLVAPVLQSACSLAATSVRQKLLPYSTEAEATTQWSDPGPFAKMKEVIRAADLPTTARTDHRTMQAAAAMRAPA
jgi:hypothetical protein